MVQIEWLELERRRCEAKEEEQKSRTFQKTKNPEGHF
jgi:hypothetical protein